MKESEYRKQLLIQQIADHRELMRLEMQVLQDANPVTPVFETGRQLLGMVGAINPKSRARSRRTIAGLRSLDGGLLVSSVLPIALQILRAVLRRHEERRQMSSKERD